MNTCFWSLCELVYLCISAQNIIFFCIKVDSQEKKKHLKVNNDMIYLKHSTHPLEAVLLTGIWSLLCHDHDPLIIEYSD